MASGIDLRTSASAGRVTSALPARCHNDHESADHKDGHVTVRSLSRAPLFYASNLDDLVAGKIVPDALEPNAAIYSRYVQWLPEVRRAKAEAGRIAVIGKATHHRARHGHVPLHDPVHSIFLVPGTGPHPGLPGNYLHGSLFQLTADASVSGLSDGLSDRGVVVRSVSPGGVRGRKGR